MLLIGLTGGIGMGKSTVAARLRALGVPVCDADAEVHKLYEGAAVAPIEAAFPGTTREDKVDRQKLAAALLEDPAGFKRLEAIVHPLVRARIAKFLADSAAGGAALAVVDIPLLFETGYPYGLDKIAVAAAPDAVIRERALQREGMTVEKLDAILARQLPQAEKLKRADYVIDTSGTIADTRNAVAALVETLTRS